MYVLYIMKIMVSGLKYNLNTIKILIIAKTKAIINILN